MPIIRWRKNDGAKKAEKLKKIEETPVREPEPEPVASGAAEEKKDEKPVIGREAMISFRRSMYSSKLIGTSEELIPFAWRQPLKLPDKKKASRIFKAIASEQVEREMRMPVKKDQ